MGSNALVGNSLAFLTAQFVACNAQVFARIDLQQAQLLFCADIHVSHEPLLGTHGVLSRCPGAGTWVAASTCEGVLEFLLMGASTILRDPPCWLVVSRGS